MAIVLALALPNLVTGLLKRPNTVDESRFGFRGSRFGLWRDAVSIAASVNRGNQS